MNSSEALEYFRGRQDHILDRIREIVDIESPSHNAEASRRVTDWVEHQIKETGVELAIERVSVYDGEHVIVRAFGGDSERALLLGHAHTVHPIRAAENNPTRIRDDNIYGCG